MLIIHLIMYKSTDIQSSIICLPLTLSPYINFFPSRCTVALHDFAYCRKEDSTMMLKKPKKGAEAFYDGLEPQSAQYLVSSMSLPSFGSSPPDARLDSHLPNSPGVHYNRGFDVDHNPSGAENGSNGNGDSYKPIQIVAADVSTPRPTSTTHV